MAEPLIFMFTEQYTFLLSRGTQPCKCVSQEMEAKKNPLYHLALDSSYSDSATV